MRSPFYPKSCGGSHTQNQLLVLMASVSSIRFPVPVLALIFYMDCQCTSRQPLQFVVLKRSPFLAQWCLSLKVLKQKKNTSSTWPQCGLSV